MTRELESRKDLVNEKATRHDGSQENSLPPVELTFVRGRVGVGSNSQHKPRPCGCNTRKLVNNRFPAHKGWGLCGGNSQSLIHDKNLTSYRLNVLTTSKKVAFTLAEVLITLGVIGIVAAMTIPTLVNNYQEKVTITKVKKMYSTLSNAYALYRIENGDSGMLPLNEEGAIQVAEIFKPYLKIAKDCGTRGTGCIKGAKLYKDGSLASDEFDSGYEKSPEYYVMTLNDGAQLVLRGGENSHNFEIFYDTNFNNNIMRVANDLFAFAGYDDKIIPTGIVDEKYKTCPSDSIGWSCTAWIIKFGNMDYLHCPEILDGETKTSCN